MSLKIIGVSWDIYILYICIYTYVWVNYKDRTLFSRSLESWFMLGKSSPFMAELFRLVNIIIYCTQNGYLVVGNMAFMTFHSVGNFHPSQLTNSIIFQRG